MAATDGTTPLNAANVVWKGGEDDHGVPGQATGHLHNYGNVEAIGGTLNTIHNAAGLSDITPRFTLGSGQVSLFCGLYASPVLDGTTYRLPMAMRAHVPFPGLINIQPSTFVFVPTSPTVNRNCTFPNPPYSGAGASGSYGCFFGADITTTTSLSIITAFLQGYILVAA